MKKNLSKKYLVLSILFIFPILIYIFLSSGVNNFAKLPILSFSVKNITEWESLNNKPVSFHKNISIVSFWGEDILGNTTGAINLGQKIYKRFYEFNDFQFVTIAKEGQENEILVLKKHLKNTGIKNFEKWKFIFGNTEEIQNLFDSFQTPLQLSAKSSTPYVFIIDKKLNLRGRKDNKEVFYGFNANSVAEIKNEMLDDIKVILAEYRLALKKNEK